MQLPVITCDGCGVCCFHMGFPAFVLPRHPLTEEEIQSHAEYSQLPVNSRRRQELLDGCPGESWWHLLPQDLKQELLNHIQQYQRPEYDGSLESLDGPCIWLDQTTRKCKHHQHRPNVCRDFETGCGDCRQWRNVYADKIQSVEIGDSR